MKEYLKNPNLYYIVIPAVSALWALWAWAGSVPAAEKNWSKQKTIYQNAQVQIDKILNLDPQRLEYKQQEGKGSQFDYSSVVEQFARVCDISSSDYSFQTGREMKRGNRTTKTATVQIKPINIEKFTKFFFTIMLPWPDLQCDQLRLTKLPAGPDAWKVNMKFTYYY